MRRRENPRHISAARLMCNSAQERRGFFEAKQAVPQDRHFRLYPGPARSRRAACLWRRRPVCGATRRASLRPRLIPPCRRLPDPHQRPRHAALIPPRRQRLLVQISQAPIVLLHCDTPAPRRGTARFRNAAPARNSRSSGSRRHRAQGPRTAAGTRAATANPSAQDQFCRSRRQCAAGLDWHRLPRTGE